METRDQWYKPNLLYNIHWRPPKAHEPPKMVVKTVRFNPSVCTCGEHNCGPHYRMERKVVWINKEKSRTTEDKKNEEIQESDSQKGLQSDQEGESIRSEVLHSKEEERSDFKCKSDTNDTERYCEEETLNREITKESLNVDYGKRLEKDENRKYDKIKYSSETDGQRNIGIESLGGGDEFNKKKEWLAKRKEDKCDGYQKDDSEIHDVIEGKGEGSDSVDSDGLIKYQRQVRVNELYDNFNDNVRTNEKEKCIGSGYFIGTGGRMKSEKDGESGRARIKERLTNKSTEDGGVKGESNGTEFKMDTIDKKSDGEIDGEDFKSNLERNMGQYCHGFSADDEVRDDDKCNGKADGGGRYVNYSDEGLEEDVNNSDDGLEKDVTEQDFLDEEISPAFGIMSIYCSSELHYYILGSCT